MAVGALIAIGSLGSGINLAVGVMVEGVKDLYATIRSAANGVAIKFKDYLTEKAISYAVIAAGCGMSLILCCCQTVNLQQLRRGQMVSTTVVKKRPLVYKRGIKNRTYYKIVKSWSELVKTVA